MYLLIIPQKVPRIGGIVRMVHPSTGIFLSHLCIKESNLCSCIGVKEWVFLHIHFANGCKHILLFLLSFSKCWILIIDLVLLATQALLSQPHFGAKCDNAIHIPKSGKMESSGTPENSEDDLRGQISLHCCVLYINGNFLKSRCLKWPRMGHLDICSPSYGQKKGRESNWQFDSRPQKVRNRPFPDVASRSVTRSWKALDESYNFGWNLVPIRARGEELWASKVPGLQPGTISGLQLGSPRKKSHSDVASAVKCREYYMGEGGGFPQVRAVVSLVCPSARGLSQHPRVFPNAN